MKRSFCCYAIALAALTLALTTGCGGPSVHRVEVTGTVTLDGEPLNGGSIKFLAADGNTPASGTTILSDGSYKAQVTPGEKKVLVVSHKVIGKEPVYQGVPDSPMREKRVNITPRIYNAAHRTPLKASIADAKNSLDFDLSSTL